MISRRLRLWPYASAAAVGSLSTRTTVSPAIAPAVAVAARDDHRRVVRPFLDLERRARLRGLDLGRLVGAADQPLDRVDRVLRVDDLALLGRRADHHAAVGVERHD